MVMTRPPAPALRLALVTGLCLAACASTGPVTGALPGPHGWRPGQGCRRAPLTVPASGKTGFTLVSASDTGIHFVNHLSENAAGENQIRLNGSGVALGDMDGDGRCDIYLCRLEGRNALYRNLGGWQFEEVVDAGGAACADQYSTGAVFADVDGDADLDLLVNGLAAGTRLFINIGKGHFTESADAGLDRKRGSTSLALADIDGDGDLDLYVVNYRSTTIRSTGLRVLNVGGKRMLRPEDRADYEFTPEGLLLEYGEVDALYLNDGKGRFTPVSWTDGAFLDEGGKPLKAPPREWGLAAQFRDMNGDGAPDLYVCNDFFSPDRIWLNDGRGRFRAMPRSDVRVTSLGSMSVDFADINRDGFEDFFVVDLLSRTHRLNMTQREPNGEPPEMIDKRGGRPQVQRNTLFLNRGDGTYAEIAQFSGVEASEWSWSAIFLDVDLDGYEDLLITTGHGRDTLDTDAAIRVDATPRLPANKKLLMFPKLDTPKVAFRNRGDLTFEDASTAWGFDAVGVSHGMALADLDNDGDLDVVVNNLNAVAGIYRNETTAPRLAVRLKGRPPNAQGIGAKIKVQAGSLPAQSQAMICGGRYLSGDDPVRVFAAGSPTNECRIEVTWPNGERSVMTGLPANCIYEIDEAGSKPPGATPPAAASARPLFTDVSDQLDHMHHETPFDDLARQQLLPNRLDRLGPGVAWRDLNGDGLEDLVIGSGRGGMLAAFLNRGGGRFERLRLPANVATASGDHAAVLAFSSAPGATTLLLAQSSYEGNTAHLLLQIEMQAGGPDLKEQWPAYSSSPGPMALADVDGDGELDLFIGGRVIPGRYPDAASSRLYRRVGGKFQLDGRNATGLTGVGLVSGAVFGDLDGDGDPDLILACEWGPLKLFRNDQGQLTPWDVPVSLRPSHRAPLTSFTGWWNGITTGDLDGDGRLDIIASNWGRNTKYQRQREQPLRLYAGDFSGHGTMDVIEAHYDRGMSRVVPWRALDGVGAALPAVRERFATFHAYAEAGVAELLGDRLNTAQEREANWLESAVFLNRGSHFEMKPLPVEAQFAPAFAVCVADLDGDGHEDVFLSQNFFHPQPDTSRYDAGRGLVLRGDGKGGLTAMSGQDSGVKVYGDQRGAALCDFDGDGRVDLVAAQNSAETKLYRNAGARAGLRVRLRGPSGNPDAIGAVLRLARGDTMGPARELHAGSGYWSQDSAVTVLALRETATRLWVRWPGGKTTTSDIPAEATEISVEVSGEVKLLRK